MSWIDKDAVLSDIMSGGKDELSTQEVVELLLEQPEQELVPVERTEFEMLFGGNFIRRVQCRNCGAIFEERVEYPYNCCPYCYARRTNHAG